MQLLQSGRAHPGLLPCAGWVGCLATGRPWGGGTDGHRCSSWQLGQRAFPGTTGEMRMSGPAVVPWYLVVELQSDMSVKFKDGTSTPARRYVLSCASPVLRGMLKGCSKEGMELAVSKGRRKTVCMCVCVPMLELDASPGVVACPGDGRQAGLDASAQGSASHKIRCILHRDLSCSMEGGTVMLVVGCICTCARAQLMDSPRALTACTLTFCSLTAGTLIACTLSSSALAPAVHTCMHVRLITHPGP